MLLQAQRQPYAEAPAPAKRTWHPADTGICGLLDSFGTPTAVALVRRSAARKRGRRPDSTCEPRGWPTRGPRRGGAAVRAAAVLRTPPARLSRCIATRACCSDLLPDQGSHAARFAVLQGPSQLATAVALLCSPGPAAPEHTHGSQCRTWCSRHGLAVSASAVLQVEEALQDTQQLQAELDKVQHRIRESERTVGASLEALQVTAHAASAGLQQLSGMLQCSEARLHDPYDCTAAVTRLQSVSCGPATMLNADCRTTGLSCKSGWSGRWLTAAGSCRL